MKTWRIDYSIKEKSGEITESSAKLKAENITTALGLGLKNVREPMISSPDVEDIVIWSVTIIDEDVF